MQNGAGLMSFSVIIAGRELRCRVTYSKRKSIALKLLPGDIVSIKCPYFTSKAQLEALLQKNAERIIKQLQGLENAQPPLSETELEQLKRQARQDMTARVQRYASLMGLEYGRIAIRAQKSRWGSCSGKKNLNFNCLLMLCPEPVRDYVAVHELCHLREMNHSPRFWALVESYCPDYRRCRKWLKENGTAIIGRIK